MSRLVCPFCGPRELEEFVFRKTIAESAATPYQAVYERANRLHESHEHWQHSSGCRAWLRVHRDPSSHAVFETILLGPEGMP